MSKHRRLNKKTENKRRKDITKMVVSKIRRKGQTGDETTDLLTKPEG